MTPEAGKSANPLKWAHARGRALPHVAWRDEKIGRLLADRDKTARDLAEARAELAAAQAASMDVPSFRRYVYAERRMASHRRERRTTARGHLVTNKLMSYSFAQSHGVAIPRIFGIWGKPEDIAWDELPDEVVIKSNTGSATRGVFPLRRVNGAWTMVTHPGNIAPSEIVDHYRAFRERGLVRGPYFAEELLHGTDANALPVDVKISAFYGEAGLVLLRSAPQHGDRLTTAFRTVLPDGSDTGHICLDDIYDGSIPTPGNLDALIEVAKRLSLSIPRAFVRVDLYDLDGRIVFGEFTPRPGGTEDYGPEHDERLGHLCERAQARLLNDAIDGADYNLRFGPGPWALSIGEKRFLPPGCPV